MRNNHLFKSVMPQHRPVSCISLDSPHEGQQPVGVQVSSLISMNNNFRRSAIYFTSSSRWWNNTSRNPSRQALISVGEYVDGFLFHSATSPSSFSRPEYMHRWHMASLMQCPTYPHESHDVTQYACHHLYFQILAWISPMLGRYSALQLYDALSNLIHEVILKKYKREMTNERRTMAHCFGCVKITTQRKATRIERPIGELDAVHVSIKLNCSR